LPEEATKNKKEKKTKEIEVNSVYSDDGKTFEQIMEEILKITIRK